MKRNQKVILEFGNRGGAHVDNIILPNVELGEKIAKSLVSMFLNVPAVVTSFDLKDDGRDTWHNATHFVGLTKMDGVMRGSVSSMLWRKD